MKLTLINFLREELLDVEYFTYYKEENYEFKGTCDCSA